MAGARRETSAFREAYFVEYGAWRCGWAGVVRVTDITVGDSESLEAALRRFNKRVQADGILTDARRHEYYEKPSERRKKKEAARRRKLRKAAARTGTRRDY